jgi:hypothetical protein
MKFVHIGRADYITNLEMVLGFVNEINTLVGRNIATYFEKPLPNKGVYSLIISNEKQEVIESSFKLLDLTFEYITITDSLIQQRYNAITDRDQYGQRRISDQVARRMLPEYTLEQIQDFCKDSSMWRCNLYGGYLGQYYAIVKR